MATAMTAKLESRYEFRVHFAAEPTESFPPVDTLPSIEADDGPIEAVELLIAAGRVPRQGLVHWAADRPLGKRSEVTSKGLSVHKVPIGNVDDAVSRHTGGTMPNDCHHMRKLAK